MKGFQDEKEENEQRKVKTSRLLQLYVRATTKRF